MKKVKIFLFLVPLSSLLFFSCKKGEGEGGRSTISGKVFKIDFVNDEAAIPDTMPATDEDVSIIYGDNSQIDDDMKTNDNGEFTFKYLRKGTYTLLMYTRNPEEGDVDFPVKKVIEIGSSNEDVVTEDVYLYKSNEGYASIYGKVYAKNYSVQMQSKTPADNYYVAGEDVYLMREGSDTYIDRIKTHYDGSYKFTRLPKGKYVVYALSEDTVLLPKPNPYLEYSSGQVPSKVKTAIESTGQQVKVTDIIIIK